MTYIDCSLDHQIMIDLIEYNGYLNWPRKRNKCIIIVTNPDERLERDKIIDKLGEPMKTIFIHCCPRNASAVPTYEELLIQECIDIRKNDEEYQKACGDCDECASNIKDYRTKI